MYIFLLYLRMARDYRHEYDTYQKDKSSYRAKLNKINRKKGTYGNGDGKDVSHKDGGKVVLEDSSKNKGRNEKSRKKNSKRKSWKFWKKKNKKK